MFGKKYLKHTPLKFIFGNLSVVCKIREFLCFSVKFQHTSRVFFIIISRAVEFQYEQLNRALKFDIGNPKVFEFNVNIWKNPLNIEFSSPKKNVLIKKKLKTQCYSYFILKTLLWFVTNKCPNMFIVYWSVFFLPKYYI